MKMLLTLCLLTFATVSANEGTPPQPAGTGQRFNVVSAQVVINGKSQPVFMRVDTWTGKTWTQVALPLGPDGNTVQFWIPDHELDGQLYKVALDQMTKK